MLLTDLRHALRGLAQRRGFTLVAVLTLALGIGATTAIFSALYHTLLRPMPFEGGERMMYVWLNGGGMMIAPSRAHLDTWKGRARSFDWMSEYEGGEYTVYGGGDPEILHGTSIERDLPRLLGAQPVLGRSFTPEEMQRNGRRAVLLSEGLWQRRYGGRRDVLGEKLELGRDAYEIVGVLPNRLGSFTGAGSEPQLWLPLLPDTSSQFQNRNLLVRLREGVDSAAASAELRLLSQRVPATERGRVQWQPQVVSPTLFVDGTTQKGLPILFAAVAAVLLIGCANIAGLLLVRVAARRREVAIRAAVGANRGSIVRLLAAESLLLAVAGGGLGLVLAVWLMDLIRMARPEDLNSLDAATLSSTTLLFAAGLTILTALLFGAVPALSAIRRNLLAPLLSGGGAGSRVTSSNRVRALLVTGQIAVSLALLVASLLLVRTVLNLRQRDVGFDARGVLALRLDLPEDTYGSSAQRKAFVDALLPMLKRLPSVRAVAHATGVPTESGMMFGSATFAERELNEAEKPSMMSFVGATPGYAAAVGIELVEGRFVTTPEAGGVVINESWAKQLWPGGGAVGQRIRLSDDVAAPWDRIVGVARDINTGTQGVPEHPQIYVPTEHEWGHGWVVLRTDLEDPLALAAPVRAAIGSVDPRLVPRDFTTMEAMLRDTIAMQHFYMLLLVCFAGLALLLSVIGLYGVISNAVAQRTAEIGIRLALGASPAMVARMVVAQGARLIAVGLLVGGAAAAAAVVLIRSSLYGVQPWDPASFAGAATVLAAAALLATYIPARRALRVDPLTTLRAE